MNNKNRTSDPKHELYRAFMELQSPEECYAFFLDLCTASERKAIEQRYEVARLLSAGRVYSDILTQTGASSATISRVNRCLKEYSAGAYRKIFERLDRKNERV